MTVKELKDCLQNIPDDLEVRIEYPNGLVSFAKLIIEENGKEKKNARTSK